MSIVTCETCGAKNRVEDRGPAVHPVCGRCGAGLEVKPAPGKPLDVTDADFAEKVLEAGSRPVLVDCWAPWCPPCRAIAPVIDRIAAEAGGRYRVAKLDTQKNPRTAGMLGIQAIPALLIFKKGAVVERMVGVQSRQAIEAALLRHLGGDS